MLNKLIDKIFRNCRDAKTILIVGDYRPISTVLSEIIKTHVDFDAWILSHTIPTIDNGAAAARVRVVPIAPKDGMFAIAHLTRRVPIAIVGIEKDYRIACASVRLAGRILMRGGFVIIEGYDATASRNVMTRAVEDSLLGFTPTELFERADFTIDDAIALRKA